MQDPKEKGGHGLARGEPENVENVGFGDLVAAKSYELIEHGLGIAHAPVGPFCHSPGGGVIKFHSFFGRDMLEVAGNNVGWNGAKVKALAARNDGGEDLVRLGGCKDKLHVGRWFLEGFEEGVESARGEHVDLINVNNTESAGGGREAHGFEEGANFVHLVVGSAIDFQNVE